MQPVQVDLRLIAIQTLCNHKIRKKGNLFIEGCEDSKGIQDMKMRKMPVETAKYNRNKTLNPTYVITKQAKQRQLYLHCYEY